MEDKSPRPLAGVVFPGSLLLVALAGAAEAQGSIDQPPAEPRAAGEEQEAPSLPEVVARLDEGFEKSLVEQKIVGMSVVIVHDQDVLLAKGYGTPTWRAKRPPTSRPSIA